MVWHNGSQRYLLIIFPSYYRSCFYCWNNKLLFFFARLRSRAKFSCFIQYFCTDACRNYINLTNVTRFSRQLKVKIVCKKLSIDLKTLKIFPKISPNFPSFKSCLTTCRVSACHLPKHFLLPNPYYYIFIVVYYLLSLVQTNCFSFILYSYTA